MVVEFEIQVLVDQVIVLPAELSYLTHQHRERAGLRGEVGRLEGAAGLHGDQLVVATGVDVATRVAVLDAAAKCVDRADDGCDVAELDHPAELEGEIVEDVDERLDVVCDLVRLESEPRSQRGQEVPCPLKRR